LGFTNTVDRLIPFQFTPEAFEKFDPFTVSVRVDAPANADAGASDDRTGTALYPGPVTVVAECAVLLLASGSGCVALTVAMFVTVPDEVGSRTSATVAVAPLARLPRLQRVIGVPLQLPWLGFTVTKIAPDETKSVSVTPDAEFGPLFLTVIVVCALTPVTDEVGADSETATSAGLAPRSRTRAFLNMYT
jgi:hypothetical protein